MNIAEEANLDLVEISPDATPPVCKIMDYGKYKYEQGVKERENRKRQTTTEIKEMKFRLRIEENDYETKKRHIVKFLEDGHKVKVTVMMKGREQSRPEAGFRLLTRIAEDLADLVKTDTPPALYGRDITMVLQPVGASRK